MLSAFDRECDAFAKDFIKDYKPVFRYVRKKGRYMLENGQYVLDKNGKRKRYRGLPVGLLVACKIKGKIKIGYSKCMLKRGGVQVDQYRRNNGIYVAGKRLLDKPLKKKDLKDSEKIPHTIRQYLPRFIKDVKKYFKIEEIG